MSLVRRSTATLCKRCYSSASRPELHDLVAVGGGPAGLALTAALASSESISSSHRITLIEGSPLSTTRDWSPKPGKLSNRVSSITSDNIQFLSRTGIWQHVDHSRVREVHEMQVWDGISDARIEFQAPTLPASNLPGQYPFEPSKRSSMATLTENLNLQRAALKRIEETGNVELIDQMRVESIVKSSKEEGGWPVVNLANKDGTVKRSIRARLLIGADGANSPVKSYSDIETFGWAYDRQGVVSSLDLDPSVMGEGTNTAWQRFLPEGPIAFLPLSDTTASLVWSTTPTYASLLKAIPSSALTHLINLAFCLPYPELSSLLTHLETLHSTSSLPSPEELSTTLKEIHVTHLHNTYDANNPQAPLPPHVVGIQPSTTASFPLRLSHVSSYLGLPSSDHSQDLRTVLVGDAAHTIHPLAGQGLNMGLSDSSSLVKLLTTLSEKGTDLGSYVGLLPYPRERYTKNHALLSTCDHLNSLYSSQLGPVVWARSTGLEVVNELSGVKELLMGGAGGNVEGSKVGGGRSAGAWGVVAGVAEGVGKVTEMVGMVGGLVGGLVKQRAKEFVVKGR
ncbi:hypothetical protein JCM16303_001422 [Sporobolomyces ruberrimus]